MKKVIIPIIVIIIISSILAFNSFVNLSYTRRKFDKYTFMLPKEIEYVDNDNYAKLTHDDIIDSSLAVYSYPYEIVKGKLRDYVFYDCISEVISSKEEKLNGRKLYTVLKKLKYYDNETVTYMLGLAYEFEDDSLFIINIECSDEGKIKKFESKLKKTLISIKEY